MTPPVTGLFMLDTNIVSDMARNPQGVAARRAAAVGAGLGAEAICVSIITAAELRYGCLRKGSARLTAQVDAILGAVQVLALDAPADAQYGRLRAALDGAGTPIGPNDLLIAAHALAAGAVLVTANTGEFARVPGLRIANWLVEE